jgi:hypothetical protein
MGDEMIQGIVVEGVIRAVAEVGMDKLIDEKQHATIDLAPVTAALDELNQHSRDMFAAISRPTQTAGEEMTDRSVTAFTEGWYDDALGDALKSIELYPYSSKPRLVGGLAAIALGQGEKGLQLLISAVKYAANGQPEVGAVAAIVASHLSQTVGGSNLARRLLEDADKLTAQRCPAIAGALWRQPGGTDSRHAEQLKQLWWDDQNLTSTKYSRSEFADVVKAAQAPGPEYLAAGDPFRHYLDEIIEVAQSNLTAFDALTAQVSSFVAKRKVSIDISGIKKALGHTTLQPAFGFWDRTVMDMLGKCRTAAQGGSQDFLQGLSGAAKWPGDDAWKNPNATNPSAVRDVFAYASQACSRLLAALDELPVLAGAGSKLPAADRATVNSALPSRSRWVNAITAVRAEANVAVADQAVRAWERYQAIRRSASSQPVTHLQGLGVSLFAVVGGLDPADFRTLVTAPALEQLTQGSLVTIKCPGCKTSLQVASATKITTCTQCRKKIVFNRCSVTKKTYPVLSEWKSWTHSGCKTKHKVIQPAANA